MAEEIMPAAEAAVATGSDESEQHSYELAFHVLPTVAEGEVAGVFESLKTRITKAGGVLFAEEAPERVDLAYDIVKAIEGKNRRFHSAYFGWVRFTLESEKIEALTENIEETNEVLRHLMIRLTKQEEANPFKFHEAIKEKKVRVVEEKEILTEATTENKEEVVSEVALDESLEKITEEEGTDAEKKEEKSN